MFSEIIVKMYFKALSIFSSFCNGLSIELYKMETSYGLFEGLFGTMTMKMKKESSISFLILILIFCKTWFIHNFH